MPQQPWPPRSGRAPSGARFFRPGRPRLAKRGVLPTSKTLLAPAGS